jgi:hypothetical protein
VRRGLDNNKAVGGLPETSVFRLWAGEAHRLFADEAFVDLFADVGRRSIAPRVVAVVVLKPLRDPRTT